MKKLLTLALAVLMCVFAISAMADTVSIDRTLELQFVPSKDADVIITGTKNLPELLKAALLEQGYDVKDINITVGTNYEATGEAMAAGTVDLGWLPGGDKHVTTHWETTRTAILAALNLLCEGGVCVICAYPGHAAGDEERERLTMCLAALRPQDFNVLHQRFINAGPGSPECFILQKQTGAREITALEK